jgi:hypothetical protein
MPKRFSLIFCSLLLLPALASADTWSSPNGHYSITYPDYYDEISTAELDTIFANLYAESARRGLDFRYAVGFRTSTDGGEPITYPYVLVQELPKLGGFKPEQVADRLNEESSSGIQNIEDVITDSGFEGFEAGEVGYKYNEATGLIGGNLRASYDGRPVVGLVAVFPGEEEYVQMFYYGLADTINPLAFKP